MEGLKILIAICFCTNIIIGQDIPVIDYHVHVFSDKLLANFNERGIGFKKGVFETDCSNNECLELDKLKANNSSKLVLLSAGYAYQDPIEDSLNIDLQTLVKQENEMLQKLVFSDRENLYGLCGINPSWEFAEDEVKRCIHDLQLDGIKLHFQSSKINLDDTTSISQVKKIFKVLSKVNKPALIHINGTDLNAGKQIALKFIKNFLENEDSQTIIFAHSGGVGGLYPFNLEILSEYSKFISTNPYSKFKKIYFELSGTILTYGYPGKVENEELAKLMKQIGFKHFLFGSDYPFRNSKKYQQLIESTLIIPREQLTSILTRNIFENE